MPSPPIKRFRSQVIIDKKRYYTFNRFLKERFGVKVKKVSIDAGFSCPNRDGKVGSEGCIYCYNPAFLPESARGRKTIARQIEEAKARAKKRRFKGRYLAYFQAYSNTYAPLEELRKHYDEAIEDKEVLGLAVGTRPDCVTKEVLSLLEDYAKKYHVWMEYGLQSTHDETLKLINRGHDFARFEEAVTLTRNRGIFICVHIILGLPGEDVEHMYETIKKISDLNIDGVKIHHLQVVKGTALEEMYRKRKVKVYSLEEYIPLVCNIIERIPARMVIHRLVGDIREDLLTAPLWKIPKTEIIAQIDRELARRGTGQGWRRGDDSSP